MNQSDLMGKRVRVTKKYCRVYSGDWRKWEILETEIREGWIVGFRTIWNGYMDHDTGDYGQVEATYFVHDSHHNCALVAFSPRQNPVKVPMDGFELVGAGGSDGNQ